VPFVVHLEHRSVEPYELDPLIKKAYGLYVSVMRTVLANVFAQTFAGTISVQQFTCMLALTLVC